MKEQRYDWGAARRTKVTDERRDSMDERLTRMREALKRSPGRARYPTEAPAPASGWRKIPAWIVWRWSIFQWDHFGLIVLWLLGLLALPLLAVFRVWLPQGYGELVVELLGLAPSVAVRYPFIPLAAVYVALVVVSAVVAPAWRITRWAIAAAVMLWVWDGSLLGVVLGGAAGLVGAFIYEAIQQHLANQRRIIAALERKKDDHGDE